MDSFFVKFFSWIFSVVVFCLRIFCRWKFLLFCDGSFFSEKVLLWKFWASIFQLKIFCIGFFVYENFNVCDCEWFLLRHFLRWDFCSWIFVCYIFLCSFFGDGFFHEKIFYMVSVCNFLWLCFWLHDFFCIFLVTDFRLMIFLAFFFLQENFFGQKFLVAFLWWLGKSFYGFFFFGLMIFLRLDFWQQNFLVTFLFLIFFRKIFTVDFLLKKFLACGMG